MKQEPCHVHEVKNYLTCRLLWFWTAPRPRGLNLEPNRPVAALNTGRLTHRGLQEYYDEGVAPDVAFASAALKEQMELEKQGAWERELAEMTQDIETISQVLRTYVRWAERADQNCRFVATETKWEVKYDRIPFAGKMDALVEREDGLWVLDFKTTSFTKTDWTAQDLQATMYVMAARKLYGDRVQGMVYRFLRKKAPYTYENLVLKKGGVTRRKDLADLTTYGNYRMTLAILTLAEIVPGLELVEYEAMLLGLDKNNPPSWYADFKPQFVNVQRFYWDELQKLKGRNTFLWEVKERRTPSQIQMYMKHVVVPAAKEMRSRRKGRWIGPTGLGNAWANCRRCGFKDPCIAVMAGANYRSLLESQYHQRDRTKEDPDATS